MLIWPFCTNYIYNGIYIYQFAKKMHACLILPFTIISRADGFASTKLVV